MLSPPPTAGAGAGADDGVSSEARACVAPCRAIAPPREAQATTWAGERADVPAPARFFGGAWSGPVFVLSDEEPQTRKSR